MQTNEPRYEQTSFLDVNGVNTQTVDKTIEVYSTNNTTETPYVRRPRMSRYENREESTFIRKPFRNPDLNTRNEFNRRTPSEFTRRPLNKFFESQSAAEQSFSQRLSNNVPEGGFVRRLPNKAFAADGSEASDQAREVFVRRLPNKAFDQEYMTEWVREVKFLQEKGIRYVYVKKTPDYGVSQFKYKKTPELFAALFEFYTQVTAEKANVASFDEAQEALKGSGIEIRRGRNGDIKFIKNSSQETPVIDDRVVEEFPINKPEETPDNAG